MPCCFCPFTSSCLLFLWKAIIAYIPYWKIIEWLSLHQSLIRIQTASVMSSGHYTMISIYIMTSPVWCWRWPLLSFFLSLLLFLFVGCFVFVFVLKSDYCIHLTLKSGYCIDPIWKVIEWLSLHQNFIHGKSASVTTSGHFRWSASTSMTSHV